MSLERFPFQINSKCFSSSLLSEESFCIQLQMSCAYFIYTSHSFLLPSLWFSWTTWEKKWKKSASSTNENEEQAFILNTNVLDFSFFFFYAISYFNMYLLFDLIRSDCSKITAYYIILYNFSTTQVLFFLNGLYSNWQNDKIMKTKIFKLRKITVGEQHIINMKWLQAKILKTASLNFVSSPNAVTKVRKQKA